MTSTIRFLDVVLYWLVLAWCVGGLVVLALIVYGLIVRRWDDRRQHRRVGEAAALGIAELERFLGKVAR